MTNSHQHSPPHQPEPQSIIDVMLLEQLAIYESRESFYSYRCYMHPKMRQGWFTEELARIATEFYHELIDGNRPKYAIEAPPQHGKSTLVVDLISWIAGRHPEFRQMYTSFSERLGIRANLAIQRMLTSEKYKLIFPETKIAESGNNEKFGAIRNRDLLEFIDNDGCFRNTTVKGQITGESLDIGYIDDPLKGRDAANSKVIREAIWDWFTDDFFTRFSDQAGMLFVMTRWHIDDPLSRAQASFGSEMKVFKFPAIATENEKFRKEGEPLFPELKSMEFLTERKELLPTVSWLSLYQQSPIQPGGNIIQGCWFKKYTLLPPLEYRMMYADTAQKVKEANDYSVIQCWGKERGYNRIYLLDQIRGKWEAPELKSRAISFWNKHKSEEYFPIEYFGGLRKLKVEDKASGTGLIQEIRTNSKQSDIIPIEAIQRFIDKYTRVSDAAPSIEAGFVYVPELAPFTNDYIAEFECFTADDSHLHDDQVDPTCDAIKDMLGNTVIRIWEMLGAM